MNRKTCRLAANIYFHFLESTFHLQRSRSKFLNEKSSSDQAINMTDVSEHNGGKFLL